MGGFPSGQRGQTVTLLVYLSKVRILLLPLFLQKELCLTVLYIHLYWRGVEQLAARRAHNPKVVGSSPASAILKTIWEGGFFTPKKRANEPVGRRFESCRPYFEKVPCKRCFFCALKCAKLVVTWVVVIC